MNFGMKLEKLRTQFNLNKKQLAFLIGVSADTISIYEKKTSIEGIDALKLKKIADYFKVSIDYLASSMERNLDNIDNIEIIEYEYLQNNINDTIHLEKLTIELMHLLKHKRIFYHDIEDKNKLDVILECIQITDKILENM